MTATTPPAATTTPEPPRTVVLASRLLYAAAVLQLAMGGIAIYNTMTVPEKIRAAVTGFPSETAAIVGEAILDGGVAFLLALGGYFVARGRQWARIVAYLVVLLQFFAGAALSAQEFFGALLDGVDLATYETWRDSHLVATVAGKVGAILMVLAPIAAIVLLSVKQSRPYFRRRAQVTEWTPPTFRAG